MTPAIRTPAALSAALLVHATIVWLAARPTAPVRLGLTGRDGIEISLASGPAAPAAAVAPVPAAPPPPRVAPPPKPAPPKARKPVPAAHAVTAAEVAPPAPIARAAPAAPAGSAAATASAGSGGGGGVRGAHGARRSAASAYLARLRSWIERHKRYPTAARLRNIEGMAELRFVMDRRGNVVSSHLAQRSGHALLDQEVLAMLRRASPLPPIPSDMRDDRLELVFPVVFQLHARRE